MLIPSQPIASAPASCLPSAIPPEARNGTLSLRAALGNNTIFPTSSLPDCTHSAGQKLIAVLTRKQCLWDTTTGKQLFDVLRVSRSKVGSSKGHRTAEG